MKFFCKMFIVPKEIVVLQCLTSLFTCITRNYGSIITAQIWMKNFLWWIPFFISKICCVEAWCGIYLHGCIKCYKLTSFSASRANLVCQINIFHILSQNTPFRQFLGVILPKPVGQIRITWNVNLCSKKRDILSGFNFLVWALARRTIIQYSITQTAYMHNMTFGVLIGHNTQSSGWREAIFAHFSLRKIPKIYF